MMRKKFARCLVVLPALVAGTPAPVHATWSIVMADRRTAEVAVGTVTCLNQFDLLALVPVVLIGKGAGACQAAGDFDGIRRPIIFDGLAARTHPNQILNLLSGIEGHQERQYGIADTLGRTVTFSGASNFEWKGGVTGAVGDLVYAIQGNILAGDCVVPAIEQAVRDTEGDIPAKLMAGMQAAFDTGGDGRCSCAPANPTACGCPPSSYEKVGHIGGMIVARIGDTDDGFCSDTGCADGNYFMRLNVSFQSSSRDDPVMQLQEDFKQWRAARNGRPDAVQSAAAITPERIIADGSSTATLNITLADWEGNPPSAPIDSVVVSHAPSSAGSTTIGPMMDHGDGTYSVTLTTGTSFGVDRLRVVVDDGVRPVTIMPDAEFCVGPASLPFLASDPSGIEPNRLVAFQTPTGASAAANMAVRVTPVELYRDATQDAANGCPPRVTQPDLSQLEGQTRWLGPPAEFPEDSVPTMPNFIAAPLQCCPHFRDWSQSALASEFGGNADVSLVYAFGAEVVPCSTYRIEPVAAGSGDVSCPVTVSTGLWGDVAEPFGGTGQPSFLDIGNVVAKFKSFPAPIAPKKAEAMLRGNIPPLASRIGFEDIGRAVLGFKTLPYFEVGPDPSACSDPCP